MNQNLKIAGCDCGKSSLYVCVMTELPSDLKRFVRSHKTRIYQATAVDMAEFLLLDVDLYVLEPTGAYSYIWIDNLEKAGKAYRLVSSRRVRHYCEYQGVINKADKPDAAAIAAYSYQNFLSPHAFLGLERLRIRELYLQAASTSRSKNPIENRLGQRLAHEFPEYVKTYETVHRNFLEPVPFPFRFIAGEELTDSYRNRRNKLLTESIGSGLSEHTRALARQLCEFEKIGLALDEELNAEMMLPEFERYHKIFEPYQVPPRVKAAILSRIYPFEDFLRDGKPIKEYIQGEHTRRKSGMTKRDRSEGEFKLSLGIGQERHQSGGKDTFKKSGAKYARTAIWQYIKITIVIHAVKRGGDKKELNQNLLDLEKEHTNTVSPWLNLPLIYAVAELTKTTPEVASLRIHYAHQTDKKGNQKVMSTAGRFTRMLYKDLVNEFRVQD